MTNVFSNREFVAILERGGGLYNDMEFTKCRFVGCRLSITRDPQQRSKATNIVIRNCEVSCPGSALCSAIVEDTIVDGLKTNGTFQTWGAVFKHVTLRGPMGCMMFSPYIAPGHATDQEQRAFDEANSEYYRTVDWALDIRDAQFEDVDIRRIPACLILRDPATQIVLRREKTITGTWRSLDLSKTHWPTAIQFFLNEGSADTVLVAPKRARNFQQLLDGLKLLRDAGVAEPT
jgi:hypothetical protein